MGLGMEIGVDLGTSSVLVYIRGKGIVLKEPSVVAVNSKTGKVLAVGESASLMLGRTPGIVEAIRPLREGVISDFRATEVMLKAFIGRVCTGLRATYFKPTIVVCVPSVITPVEQQAVENACRHAGAKDVFLIREREAVFAFFFAGTPCPYHLFFSVFERQHQNASRLRKPV